MGRSRTVVQQTFLDQTAIGLALELGEERADAGFIACRQSRSRGVDERDHRALVLVQEVDLLRRVEAGGGWDANREVHGRLGFVEGDRTASSSGAPTRDGSGVGTSSTHRISTPCRPRRSAIAFRASGKSTSPPTMAMRRIAATSQGAAFLALLPRNASHPQPFSPRPPHPRPFSPCVGRREF